MTSETYKTKTGVLQFRPVMNEAEYTDTHNDGVGFCLACGAEASDVEPDARKYTCDTCGAAKVYGLEELLIMGLLKFDGD